MKTTKTTSISLILLITCISSGCQTLTLFDQTISDQDLSTNSQVSKTVPESDPEEIDVVQLSRQLPIIFFASGSTQLSNEARKQIRDIALLFNHPDIIDQTLTIAGHSDTSGDVDTNLALSAKRAESVSRELVLNGIRNERLLIQALGENQPQAIEILEDGEFDPLAADKNRRVEIYLGAIDIEKE